MIQAVATTGAQRTERLSTSKARIVYSKLVTTVLIDVFSDVQMTQSRWRQDERASRSTRCSRRNRLTVGCSDPAVTQKIFLILVYGYCLGVLSDVKPKGHLAGHQKDFFPCANQWLTKSPSLRFRNTLFLSSHTRAPPW